MASEATVLLKHYAALAKTIESFSNGQAFLSPRDDDGDDLRSVKVTLTPRGGPYRGGTFDFEFDLSDGYPTCPPVVHSLNPVYHPNIDWYDDQGDVCLNLFDELWSAEMTLEDVVQGLLFLFHQPNLEDPLNPIFSGDESEEEFQVNVRRSLRGETVDTKYEGPWCRPRNLPDDYESDTEDDDTEDTSSTRVCSVENQEENEEEEEAVPSQLQIVSTVPPSLSRSVSINKPTESVSFTPRQSQESSVDKDDSVSSIRTFWGSLRPYVVESLSRVLAGFVRLPQHQTSVVLREQAVR